MSLPASGRKRSIRRSTGFVIVFPSSTVCTCCVVRSVHHTAGGDCICGAPQILSTCVRKLESALKVRDVVTAERMNHAIDVQTKMNPIASRRLVIFAYRTLNVSRFHTG